MGQQLDYTSARKSPLSEMQILQFSESGRTATASSVKLFSISFLTEVGQTYIGPE